LKKITIVYLPDGINAVKQFKIPKILFNLILAVAVLATTVLVWASYDYLKLKKDLPDNESLLKENSLYKNQLSSLAGKIDQINKKVAELKAFETKLKVMVNLETGKQDTQFLGVGGSDFSLLEKANSSANSDQKLINLMHSSLDNLNTEISVQSKDKAELFDFLKSQKSLFSCTPSILPAVGWVSSRFGYRISPFTSTKEFHKGLDISSRVGTEIVSPADGIISAIDKTDGLGNSITINHGYGYQTVYGHLSQVLVGKGQAVKRNDKIALMGNTGRSTGPHLHYEVHLNDIPVNPEKYILN
jgi:murein DD-endopeptidase MepM/ murein hydrolase activator NlpD